MKHMYPTVILTGLLALALGLSACSSLGSDSSGSTGSGSSSASGTSGTSGTSGSSDGMGSSGGRSLDTSMQPGSASTGTTLDPSDLAGQTPDQSGAMGASGARGATGSSDAQAQGSQRSGMPAAANATPNGTVVSIEPLASNERSISGSSSGSSSGSAGSSASGATGSASTGQAYRVTVRMDDGSTQVITQAGTPAFRSGDRINLGSGVISR